MNLKAANIIAVELAILIALMSWLVYSRFPPVERRSGTETQESNGAPGAAVAFLSEPGDQRSSTVGYRPDQQAQLAAEQQALIRYQQEITPRRYARAGLMNGVIAADSPSDTEADQEQALVSPDDAASPQTVAYVQPAQVVEYPQPVQTIVYSQPSQIVVFSTPRRFANRCRPASHAGALPPMANRCRDSRKPHLNGSTEFRPAKSIGLAPRRNAHEFRPQDHR
jgi:hypothetical protein